MARFMVLLLILMYVTSVRDNEGSPFLRVERKKLLVFIRI